MINNQVHNLIGTWAIVSVKEESEKTSHFKTMHNKIRNKEEEGH